jgi:mannan polymerase II complex MNN11 subunit
MASYTRDNLGAGYEDGDFVAMFTGCTTSGEFNCEDTAMPYYKRWQELARKAS